MGVQQCLCKFTSLLIDLGELDGWSGCTVLYQRDKGDEVVKKAGDSRIMKTQGNDGDQSRSGFIQNLFITMSFDDRRFQTLQQQHRRLSEWETNSVSVGRQRGEKLIIVMLALFLQGERLRYNPYAILKMFMNVDAHSKPLAPLAEPGQREIQREMMYICPAMFSAPHNGSGRLCGL